MRRPVPFTVDGGVPPGNPDGEVDPVPDEGEPTPSPAPSPTNPDWSEQSCDPETEVCNVDPDRTYSWYQECTKPPSATCSSSGPGGYRREHVSVCADPAAKGYSWDKGPMAVGQVPDQEALMRACGFRNEFDYGWQYSCSDGGPVSCLGHNSYTGETRQFSDDTCLNAETPEWRSEALGWTGVGAKPNKDMMCNTQMGGFRTGDLMAKDTVSGDEEPYVCAYRAYRHVEVVCTYQGTQIDVSHPACIAKQKKFIKDQADYSPAEWRIVTPGVLEETRSLSDDPRMWDSCDWRYSHNVENPYCYAANLQDGEVYENEYSHGFLFLPGIRLRRQLHGRNEDGGRCLRRPRSEVGQPLREEQCECRFAQRSAHLLLLRGQLLLRDDTQLRSAPQFGRISECRGLDITMSSRSQQLHFSLPGAVSPVRKISQEMSITC